MKINRKSIQDYFYLFLLLCFSGNPLFYHPEASKMVFSILTVLLVIRHFKKLMIIESKHLYFFIAFFSVIFTLQFLILGFVSLPGLLGFLLKLVFGYIIISVIGSTFSYIYFNTIFFISLVSLLGYLWNLAGFDIPSIYTVKDVSKTIILFTQRFDGARNSGMFWEPGAFACYINLAFLFYLGNIKELLKNKKTKSIIILTALVTTFSTTGYIVFFFYIITNSLFGISWRNAVLIVPLLILFSLFCIKIYEKSDFLKEKIEIQYLEAVTLEGKFSGNRFGALVFDVYYIKKHPLIGNGIHPKTRFAYHPYLQNEQLGHGNGFSNYLASMGFLSLFFYSYYILKLKTHNKWIFLIIIFLILQGEPLMNFPLFLTIPFILLFNENNSYTDNLSQQA